MTRLTEVPGSSDYVDRGVVVYSNQSKTDLLGVPPSLIAAHGAVSEPVAEAMASAMARIARCDIAVGITGVAGPGGGTPDKPVGMVAIAAAWARSGGIETRVRTFNFVGGREMIRFQASQAALDMVKLFNLAYRPSLTSNHIRGKAIDMNISWKGTLELTQPAPLLARIEGRPRTEQNRELHQIGASVFGVRKLISDPPHWSFNGR